MVVTVTWPAGWNLQKSVVFAEFHSCAFFFLEDLPSALVRAFVRVRNCVAEERGARRCQNYHALFCVPETCGTLRGSGNFSAQSCTMIKILLQSRNCRRSPIGKSDASFASADENHSWEMTQNSCRCPAIFLRLKLMFLLAGISYYNVSYL